MPVTDKTHRKTYQPSLRGLNGDHEYMVFTQKKRMFWAFKTAEAEGQNDVLSKYIYN